MGLGISNGDENAFQTIITDIIKSSDACTVVEFGFLGSERSAIHDAGRAAISISNLGQQRIISSMVLIIKHIGLLSLDKLLSDNSNPRLKSQFVRCEWKAHWHLSDGQICHVYHYTYHTLSHQMSYSKSITD